jgi:hypothetical protein
MRFDILTYINRGPSITGTAVGTGRAIALRLAAQGGTVVLADLDDYGGPQTPPSALELVRQAGAGVVINLGSSAVQGYGPQVSPEYSTSTGLSRQCREVPARRVPGPGRSRPADVIGPESTRRYVWGWLKQSIPLLWNAGIPRP